VTGRKISCYAEESNPAEEDGRIMPKRYMSGGALFQNFPPVPITKFHIILKCARNKFRDYALQYSTIDEICVTVSDCGAGGI